MHLPAAIFLAVSRHWVASIPRSRAERSSSIPSHDGKVDQHTFNGYRRYGESCLRCHGPDGAGSCYAPSLVELAETPDEDQFAQVVINGRQNVTSSQNNVMPAFGTTEES